MSAREFEGEAAAAERERGGRLTRSKAEVKASQSLSQDQVGVGFRDDVGFGDGEKHLKSPRLLADFLDLARAGVGLDLDEPAEPAHPVQMDFHVSGAIDLASLVEPGHTALCR